MRHGENDENIIESKAGAFRHPKLMSALAAVMAASLAAVASGANCQTVAQTNQRVEKVQQKQERKLSQLGDFETRGKQLRSAIDKIYADTPIERKAVIDLLPIRPGKEISDAFKPFIPLGISFDEAEAVLQRAGFKIVQPRKEDRPSKYSNELSTYDVVAELPMTPDKPASRMGVRVVLLPRKIMDYGAVSGVIGRIYKNED